MTEPTSQDLMLRERRLALFDTARVIKRSKVFYHIREVL
ncbi:hypothetical protein ABID25_006548 [Mesorhizobium abyssinicae]